MQKIRRMGNNKDLTITYDTKIWEVLGKEVGLDTVVDVDWCMCIYIEEYLVWKSEKILFCSDFFI